MRGCGLHEARVSPVCQKKKTSSLQSHSVLALHTMVSTLISVSSLSALAEFVEMSPLPSAPRCATCAASWSSLLASSTMSWHVREWLAADGGPGQTGH